MSNDEPVEGRCNAHPTQDGGYCAKYPIRGRDKCRSHGGKSPRGMDSPNAIHGLRSEYMDDETQEIYEAVAEQSNADIVQEEIWAIKARILRAAKESGNNEAVMLVRNLTEKIDEEQAIDPQIVNALAKMIRMSSSSLDRALGRMNDLVRTHHKITEGETVNVNAGDEWRELMSGDEK